MGAHRALVMYFRNWLVPYSSPWSAKQVTTACSIRLRASTQCSCTASGASASLMMNMSWASAWGGGTESGVWAYCLG